MFKRTIRFRASDNAMIGLFPSPSCDSCEKQSTLSYYSIIIGGWDNTASLITRYIDGSSLFFDHKVDSAGPCKPDEWVTVTVAFVGGNTVVVSMGETHGENVLMQWTDPDPLKVNYVSVMTWGTEGDWEFEPVENPRQISKR
jgi:hypothetical protein